MKRLLALVVGFLLLTSPASAENLPDDTESGLALPRMVSLRSNLINARSGPGARYPIEWVYRQKGAPVEIIAEFELWRKIRDWDGSLKKVADLYAPETGIGVETWSTEPAFLTFTGRTFDGSETGKYGPMEKFCGMLLETFHLADSPNRPEFPTTELRPDDKFTSVTEWHFYVE